MRYAEVLDAEWRRLSNSPEACRRLRTWAMRYPALAGYADLQDVLDARTISEAAARPILLALAKLAPQDEIAARTLLQAVLPRIVRLVATKCTDDPTADEELVALTWERIRTYPPARIGSVAANIMRDAYKQYRADHRIKAPKTRTLPVESVEALEPRPSAEDEAMSYVLIGELVRARDRGLVSTAAIGLILRTRVAETPLPVISAEQGIGVHTLITRRFRAETRLRRLPLAG
jgi:hypothetical protein